MLVETAGTIRNPARLAVLRRLELLDTPAEEVFDRLTRFAARKLGVPISLVNLIDEERQFFKSATGMGELRELPVATGVCSYALTSGQALVIEDARTDPRFSANPIVTDYGLVAYVGIPLNTSTGHAIGTFCVVDSAPRSWEAKDFETVRNLAGAVITEIELRLEALDLEEIADGNAAALLAAAASRQRMRELNRQVAWTAHACLGIIEDLESAADWGDDVAAGELVQALVANLFTLAHSFWPGGRRKSDGLLIEPASALRAGLEVSEDSPLKQSNLAALAVLIHRTPNECEECLDLETLTLTVDGVTYTLKPIIAEIRSLWGKIVAQVDEAA